MARIRVWNGGSGQVSACGYEFTVLLLPVYESGDSISRIAQKARSRRLRISNPIRVVGFQVTVPSLPGIVTFGRTETEAMEMAKDAIRCHIKGLKKDGEEVPSEHDAQFRKLRIPA